jgi:hypothetical protein
MATIVTTLTRIPFPLLTRLVFFFFLGDSGNACKHSVTAINLTEGLKFATERTFGAVANNQQPSLVFVFETVLSQSSFPNVILGEVEVFNSLSIADSTLSELLE